VGAIADDVRDLTTTHAETKNEAKVDESISSLEGQDSIEVTAVFGEVSGLDTGKTNPFFDGSERAEEHGGASRELRCGEPNCDRVSTDVADCPTGMAQPP
jgi:hypothetical protein